MVTRDLVAFRSSRRLGLRWRTEWALSARMQRQRTHRQRLLGAFHRGHYPLGSIYQFHGGVGLARGVQFPQMDSNSSRVARVDSRTTDCPRESGSKVNPPARGISCKLSSAAGGARPPGIGPYGGRGRGSLGRLRAPCGFPSARAFLYRYGPKDVGSRRDRTWIPI